MLQVPFLHKHVMATLDHRGPATSEICIKCSGGSMGVLWLALFVLVENIFSVKEFKDSLL